MGSTRLLVPAGVLGLALLLAGGTARPAAAQEAAREWSQTEVTANAQRLATAVKELRDAARKSPDKPVGAARRAQYAAREDLRLLQNTTRRLASLLEKGAGRDETWPVFRRIQTLRRDAEEEGRKADIGAPVLDRVVAAQALVAALEPYYREP